MNEGAPGPLALGPSALDRTKAYSMAYLNAGGMEALLVVCQLR